MGRALPKGLCAEACCKTIVFTLRQPVILKIGACTGMTLPTVTVKGMELSSGLCFRPPFLDGSMTSRIVAMLWGRHLEFCSVEFS